MAGWRHARLLSSGAGSGAQINYRSVTTTPFTITLEMLKEGINIFGINIAGIVNIILPRNTTNNKIIAIKDESGKANINHIIIRVAQ